VTYGYFGTMRTVPGHRDQVVRILLGGLDGLRDVGCSVYSVSVPADDPDLICVYEVWDSKESHDASLTLPDVRAAIAAAMPMLTGEFTSRETTVLGGLP
jgi:quinol monooxygenase YgiN